MLRANGGPVRDAGDEQSGRGASAASRRELLIGGAAAIAFPGSSEGGYVDKLELLQLHPARFIAGLIFDIAIAVVVALVGDQIVAAIKGGRHVSPAPTSGARPPIGEVEFKHAQYKASIVTLGLADWRDHRKRQIALQLKTSRSDDLRRFQVLRDYLVQEKIRLKLADQTAVWALPVNPELQIDDLFMLEYMRPESESQQKQLKLYEDLIRETGVAVFDKWYA